MQNKVSYSGVRCRDRQKLCDVEKPKMKRMRGRWCLSPGQCYSLASSPLRRPVTAAWHSRRRWHLQSVCHTGPASRPPNLPPLTFRSHSPSPFLHSPVRLLPPPRLSFLLWPPSLGPLILSLSFFSYSPLWLHTSDPLNRFTHHILKVCLPPMISQSLFAPLFCSGIWFIQPPLHILALFSPCLSPCSIPLDIYWTAISLRRDENRFSLQQLLLSD